MLTTDQIIRLYHLLDELNSLFHQEMHFNNKKYIEEFARKYYPEIQYFYYDVIWKLLPNDIQSKIENGEE